MRSQIATVLTIAGLASATGGGLAVAQSSSSTQGGAASGQYVVTGMCRVPGTTITRPDPPGDPVKNVFDLPLCPTPSSAVAPSAAPATGGGSTSNAVDIGLLGAGGAAVLAGIGLLGLGRRRPGSDQ